MRRTLPPLLITTMVMFAVAPIYVASAPYESTMGLIQKIFYYHVPSAWVMFDAAAVCGMASIWYLATRKASADRLALTGAELTVLFGLIVLVTGPLWARKAWGVWWQWDARLTLSLITWMMFVSYLILRRYGGPGSEALAAGVGIFGMANVPFVYISVNVWRTLHPTTTVATSLVPGMRGPFWFCVVAFHLLFLTLLLMRLRTLVLQAALERMHVEQDEMEEPVQPTAQVQVVER